MARFTVRIELHNAPADEYKKLHDEMEGQGFTDTITISKGTVKMPPGEYNYQGQVSKEVVLEKAKSAASKVVNSYAILVTESNGRIWFGLKNI